VRFWPAEDGCAFRALEAWPADRSPVRDAVEVPGPSAAYQSTSTLTFDDPDAGP
jgi:hypothetical protein